MQGVTVRKPVVSREKFDVLGKYLDDALTLANMSQSELARRAGLRSSSYLSKVMKGQRSVDRESLLSWCQILECPEWLEERILNAAGYASERQRQAVSTPEVLEQTHKTVLEEVARKDKER
jgi:transcriptional regulator with XRE-family HTH domain